MHVLSPARVLGNLESLLFRDRRTAPQNSFSRRIRRPRDFRIRASRKGSLRSCRQGEPNLHLSPLVPSFTFVFFNAVRKNEAELLCFPLFTAPVWLNSITMMLQTRKRQIFPQKILLKAIRVSEGETKIRVDARAACHKNAQKCFCFV